MTPTEVRNTIQSRYLDQFTGQFPIALDNQQFDPPVGNKWTRVSVQFNTGSQDSLGTVLNRKFLRKGILFIQIFTPANTATNANDDLARSSLELFEGEHIGDLWFVNGRIITIGTDGTWYQQNVVLEFNYQHIR